MFAVPLKRQRNRAEYADSAGARNRRLIRVGQLALGVNPDELTLLDQPGANVWIDIGEHAERLPPHAGWLSITAHCAACAHFP